MLPVEGGPEGQRCLSIGKAEVAHAKPCKHRQGRDEGSHQGRRPPAWSQGSFGAREQNKHCVVLTTAADLEHDEG